jgi:uncharacterized protein
MFLQGRGTDPDHSEALRWYHRAADLGDPGALTFLSGIEQEAGRYSEAKSMLEQAASQGYMRAKIQLGYLWDCGLGGRRDPERARQYFEEAAAQGYVFAKRFWRGSLCEASMDFWECLGAF